MILLIDNYDSFSYNLVQLFGTLLCQTDKSGMSRDPDADIKVIRNDAMTVDAIRALRPDHIILSPGPGYPKDAGVCEDVVRQMKGEVPLLGVCLGHQAICEVFGAEIVHAGKLMHGKQSLLSIDASDPLFLGLSERLPAARYHSLIARRDSLPDCLKVIAQDGMGEVMAVKHRDFPIYGLQFHPESILTPDGMTILKNFLAIEADAS